MKYVLLSPKDQRHDNWIVFEPRERLTLRDRYVPLRCTSCKKVDEQKAIESGIDADVRVRSKSDYVLTSDGFVLFSKRLRDLFKANKVGGYKLYSLPKTEEFFIAWPTCLVKTDPF